MAHTTFILTAVRRDGNKLSAGEVAELAAGANIKIADEHLDDFGILLGALAQSVESILAQDDYTPTPDLDKYLRTDVHIPSDTDSGGWATRCVAKSAQPSSDLLMAKSVALKDNVALAGVRCTNGTEAVKDWMPGLDATIATRIMDAGATITGKAACENACCENVSDSSCTGPVHNPYARGYSCGGSSSGSGRLVASGAVDLAIGCDQGGSIRIPASQCGVVGLKPTWGLVPYTGILSLESTIDHVGPMAKTVPDAALLLQAIAGSDGIDDRQPTFLPEVYLSHHTRLTSWLENTAQRERPLGGVKVGVLQEGFDIPGMDPNVRGLCMGAVEKLRALGAEVTNVSIPMHTQGSILWMCNTPIAGAQTGLLSNGSNRKQLMFVDRLLATGAGLTQEAFDALGPGAQNLYLRSLLLSKKYGGRLPAKCTNLLRKLGDEYNAALRECDVLVMPTLPQPACKLFEKPAEHGPLQRLTRNVGLIGNTAPFNSKLPPHSRDSRLLTCFSGTGHPALSVPVGFVPSMDGEKVRLPAGLQVVGKKFEDLECLKVGAAWERAYAWKDLSVGC